MSVRKKSQGYKTAMESLSVDLLFSLRGGAQFVSILHFVGNQQLRIKTFPMIESRAIFTFVALLLGMCHKLIIILRVANLY